MSTQPLSRKSLDEEGIARMYVDGVSARYGGGSFVFLDYRGKTYPGIAKLLEIKGNGILSIIRVERFNPPAPMNLVDLVLKKRPGVVRLKVDDAIEHERRFYARLNDSSLIQLNQEESRLANAADTI